MNKKIDIELILLSKIKDVYNHILSKTDIRIIHLSEPNELVEKIDSKNYIILLDFEFFITLSTKLKKLKNKIHNITILTSEESNKLAVKAIKLGADNCITANKLPNKLNQIIESVTQHLCKPIVSQDIFYKHSNKHKTLNGLKESEAKFRQLAENIQDVFWLRTFDKILYLNPAFEKIHDISPENVYKDASLFFGNIYPDDKKKVYKIISDQLYIETGKFDFEYRIVKKDGDIKWLSSKSSPIYDKNGKIEKLVGISKDITKHKKNIEKLEELNKTKDKFFSIVAHDLKNPFHTIIGFSEILVNDFEELSSDNLREYHYNLYETSKQTYNLLENLLDWSSSQTGKIKINIERINLKLLVSENISLLNRKAFIKKIHLINTVFYDSFVFADKNMLNTVIRNLISNAIKFTHTNGKIIVSVKSKGKYTEFTVSDTGIGMSQEDINKLFRIDLEFTNRGTANEKGTGIGLILCKEFIDKNGGNIWVESTLGKGSKFRFTLKNEAKFLYKKKRYIVK